MYGGGGAGCGCCWWLLVVEDDVGEPDDLAGHVDLLHPAVLGGLPPQLVVVPLLHTHVTQAIMSQIGLRSSSEKK